MSIRIIDDTLNVTPFLRGHMVAVSYLALQVPTANGEFDTLLLKLVDDGAVTEAAAATAVAYLVLISEYNAIGSELTNLTNIDISTALSFDVTMLNETFPITIGMDIAVANDGSGVEAGMKLNYTVPMMGLAIGRELYVLEGHVYEHFSGVRTKASIEELDDDILDNLFVVTNATKSIASVAYPVYTISSITRGSENAQTTYSVIMSADSMDLMLDLIVGIIDSVGDLGPDEYSGTPLGDIIVKKYLNSRGELISMTVSYDMEMVIDGMPLESTIDFVLEINAIGDNVKINFPADLSQYD